MGNNKAAEETEQVVEESNKLLLNRSAIDTFMGCQRKYWIENHEGGIGFVRPGNIDTVLGKAMHAAFKIILTNPGRGVTDAIAAAQTELKNGASCIPDQFQLAEAQYYVDVAVRAFVLTRAYRELHSNWQVRAAETEVSIENFSDHTSFLSTPDAVLYNGNSLTCALSIKGMKTYDELKERHYSTELQALTEPYAIYWAMQHSTEAWAQKLAEDVKKAGYKPTEAAYGNLFLSFVRGEQKVQSTTKQLIRRSPFTTCYKSMKTGELRVRYDYVDEIGANRRLGKDWALCSVMDLFKPHEWIAWLQKNDPQLIEAQFVLSSPYYVYAAQLDNFRVEYLNLAEDIWNKVNTPAPQLPSFPRRLNSRECYAYNRECVFASHCHTGVEIKSLAAGRKIEPRIPHHEGELRERLKQYIGNTTVGKINQSSTSGTNNYVQMIRSKWAYGKINNDHYIEAVYLLFNVHGFNKEEWNSWRAFEVEIRNISTVTPIEDIRDNVGGLTRSQKINRLYVLTNIDLRLTNQLKERTWPIQF